VATKLVPAQRLYPGSQVQVTCDFYMNDALTDPSTVTLKTMKPDGTISTYTWAGGTVTRAAAGQFYRDVTLDAEGLWLFRWESTGNAAGADEGEIHVLRSAFA